VFAVLSVPAAGVCCLSMSRRLIPLSDLSRPAAAERTDSFTSSNARSAMVHICSNNRGCDRHLLLLSC
jgi:hypothetical protein